MPTVWLVGFQWLHLGSFNPFCFLLPKREHSSSGFFFWEALPGLLLTLRYPGDTYDTHTHSISLHFSYYCYLLTAYHIHTLATSPMGRKLPAQPVPEPVWTLWRVEILFPLPGIEPISSAVQSKAKSL
jgi:hypothetical protein